VHQLVIKRFQHCLMHGVTMKFIKVPINAVNMFLWCKVCRMAGYI